MKLTFLSAAVALTKTIKADGTKSSYPNIKNFTSHVHEVKTLTQFYKHLDEQANGKTKPCLLKGNLSHAITNEPRKGLMPPNTPTEWICFDLDSAPFTSPDEFMRAIGLSEVSYIVQYSSSHGMNNKKTLNCHLFTLLSKPMSPQNLKAWLMHLNLKVPVLERAITLSNSHAALHWPLDITTCQNDKLIYIATPNFIGMKDPLTGKQNRIGFNQRTHDTIDISKMELHPIENLKKQALKKRDALRQALGLDPIKSKVKVIDDYTIQPGVGEASSYEIVEQNEEFTRLNINGGDSAAYWFYNHDPELLRNFKGEDFLYMKEVLPDLYKSLRRETREQNLTPSNNGDAVLAFREKRTGQYWKGLWNQADQNLDIDPVDSKDKLHDFLQGHGLVPPPYIPEWRLVFQPHNETVIDEENHICNRFVLPPALRSHEAGKYPVIQQALDSAVGTGPVQEHFLNWLAVIMQTRRKTRTAWILHGTQGTGKGILFSKVIVPILTREYTEHILATALNSDFDGWQENKLMVFIDEIEVDIFDKKSGFESKLKKLITEDTDDVHRKGQTRYSVDSYLNLIFGSNKPQPVIIPFNDRRFNVGQYQTKRWLPTEKEIEVDLPKEIPAFVNYLMTRKACSTTAGQVLHSEARESIQMLGITSAQELAKEINDGNLDRLMDYLPDEKLMNSHHIAGPYAQPYWELMRGIVKNYLSSPRCKLTRDQLQIIFGHCLGKTTEGAHRFTAYLRHNGISLKDVRINGLKDKGMEITWHCKQENLRDYHNRFNPPQPLRKVK